MEHEGDGDTNCSWCTWNGPQKLGKGTGGIRNQKENRYHHSIVKNGKNTEESSGDQRELLPLKLQWKTTNQRLYEKIARNIQNILKSTKKTKCYILTDAMITDEWKTSLTKYLPLTLLQWFEKGYAGFACERELATEHKL